MITAVLASALILTSVVLIFQHKILSPYGRRSISDQTTQLLTIATGAVVAMLVTLSSVGAGEIGGTALMLLYPRLSVARIVASYIAHSVPLTLIAGIAHGKMGSLDIPVLLSLLSGSLPAYSSAV